MKTKILNISNKNVFFLLFGALSSVPIILIGGGGFSGDFLLFSFLAFLGSLTPVFLSKKIELKPCQVRSTYQPMIPRKDLTHHNDPLLM